MYLHLYDLVLRYILNTLIKLLNDKTEEYGLKLIGNEQDGRFEIGLPRRNVYDYGNVLCCPTWQQLATNGTT